MRFPDVLTQEEAMTLQEPTASSECDFKIIDDNRHMPLASHLYLFELVAAPDLKKMVVGSISNEAASDLHGEIALMRRALEDENGLHTRCLAVWLHGAYLKDGLEAQLDRQLAPRVVVAAAKQ